MILGHHTCIRTADPDDAAALAGLFADRRPRAALLDQRREPVHPNRDELREILAKRDPVGSFYAVEDRTGLLLGVCSLRGLNREQPFAEALAIFDDEAPLAGPAGGEVAAFLADQAFVRYRLEKLIAHCLDCEPGLRAFWLAHGFVCNGLQRDVLWSRGRYHAMEVLTRLARPE